MEMQLNLFLLIPWKAGQYLTSDYTGTQKIELCAQKLDSMGQVPSAPIEKHADMQGAREQPHCAVLK